MLMPFSTRVRKMRSSLPSLSKRRLTPSASMIHSPSDSRCQIVSNVRLPTSTTASTYRSSAIRSTNCRSVASNRASFSASFSRVMAGASESCSKGQSGIIEGLPRRKISAATISTVTRQWKSCGPGVCGLFGGRLFVRPLSSLGPEFLERAAPADRERLLTVVPVVVGLNGRVLEFHQVRRHPDRQERLADPLDVGESRDVVHPACQAGESVLGVGKSQRRAVHHFNDERSDDAV